MTWSTYLDSVGARREDGVITDFGDWRAEQAAWSTGVVLTDESPRIRTIATGDDVAAFMTRLVSYAIDRLEAGTGCHAFMLNERGRIQVSFTCLRDELDTYHLETAPVWGDALATKLDMYHFGEDFQLTPDPRMALGLGGLQAESLLARLTIDVPQSNWAHTAASIAGASCRVTRSPRFGRPYFSILADADALITIGSELVSAGAIPSGTRANEFTRIEAGRPSAPGEFSDRYTPLDIGALDGLTDGKGCYPGQEVIERTIAIGRPAVQLVPIASETPLTPGDNLYLDVKTVGTVTSAAEHPLRDWVGLAAVKSRYTDQTQWALTDGVVTRRAVET